MRELTTKSASVAKIVFAANFINVVHGCEAQKSIVKELTRDE